MREGLAGLRGGKPSISAFTYSDGDAGDDARAGLAAAPVLLLLRRKAMFFTAAFSQSSSRGAWPRPRKYKSHHFSSQRKEMC